MANNYFLTHEWCRAAICIVICSIVTTSAEIPKYQWPNWRGPNYNGVSPEKIADTDWEKTGLRTLWKTSVGTGFSSFAVSNGRLFTTGNRNDIDTVYALNATTGEPIWSYSYRSSLNPKMYDGGPNSTPTVTGNEIYTVGREGHVLCLSAETGDLVWSRHLQEELGMVPPKFGFSGSPLAVDDLIILNAGNSGLALRKSDGVAVWKSDVDGAAYSTPKPLRTSNRESVAIFHATGINAIDPENGEVLWTFPWKTSHNVHAADPIVDGGRLYITSAYNTGSALLSIEKDQPEVVWKNKNLRTHFNGSILWQGHLYGFDGNANRRCSFRCIDFRTGELMWKDEGPGFGSVILAGDRLVLLSETGDLILVEPSPERFQELTRAKILDGRCWTVPVLCNGKLYARNSEGTVVCIDVGVR